METCPKANEAFKSIIKEASKYVGPESCLPGSEEDKYVLDPLEPGVSFSREFFWHGYVIREAVLEQIRECRGKVNHLFGFALFHEIFKQIHQRIKTRSGPIHATLHTYLQEEDVIAAVSKLYELLENAYGRYTVVLITNLVDFRDKNPLDFGHVVVRRVDQAYVADLPEQIDNGRASMLARVLGLENRYVSREQFLDNNKQNASLQVCIEGYHLAKEESRVFNLALYELKQLFSYLFLCQHFLTHVKEGKYNIQTKMLASNTESELQFYIRKHENDSPIVAIETTGESLVISDRIFVVTPELLEQLRKRCYLDKANEIYKSNQLGELKHKIRRSLDWFLKGVMEKDSTDEVIDLFISLESLLSTGSDPFTSHTDDLAENVAIMDSEDVHQRYKTKKQLKRLYGLRSAIIHHGKTLPGTHNESIDIGNLRSHVVWSIRGIISRIDDILQYGNGSKAIKEYFEREKLKGRTFYMNLLKNQLDFATKTKEGKVVPKS